MSSLVLVQTCVLLLQFVEAIVVLVRQTSHVRVTRALRPIFLVDCRYCGAVRRYAFYAIWSETRTDTETVHLAVTDISLIQSETCVRSSSPSHRSLTSSSCCSSSWLYLLSWVRKQILVLSTVLLLNVLLYEGDLSLLCPPRFLPVLSKHL